ncbi:MAG: protein jag [Lactobacillales bacterium]|jgi:spoIIIJ-associated protein|nr:protein jag [Lactobacillales bacterium]
MEFTGKTVEEAITQGLNLLNLSRDLVEIDVIEEGKKGFLGFGKRDAVVDMEPIHEKVEEARIEAENFEVDDSYKDRIAELIDVESIKEEIAEEEVAAEEAAAEGVITRRLSDTDAIKEAGIYLSRILKHIDETATFKVERESGKVIFQISSDHQGMVIGKHGKLINSIQYMIQIYVHRISKNKIIVNVNVGDYREKRERILTRLAKDAARDAKYDRKIVKLEPMPSFERRIVHAVLSEDSYIKTSSQGQEPNRYVVVEASKFSI